MPRWFKRKYHLYSRLFSFSSLIWEVQNISLFFCNHCQMYQTSIGLLRAIIWDPKAKVVSLSWDQSRNIPTPSVEMMTRVETASGLIFPSIFSFGDLGTQCWAFVYVETLQHGTASAIKVLNHVQNIMWISIWNRPWERFYNQNLLQTPLAF